MNTSELYFLQSIIASNFKRLAFPFKCSVAVTYRCNMRCRMCNIWKKPPNGGELTVEEIEGFFRRAGRFSWVGITGGEPFLRDDLAGVVDAIVGNSRRLCALHFATNGSLTERIVEVVGAVRKKHGRLKLVFTVSIDGPAALHDEIRGSRGCWEKAMETFSRLKKIDGVKVQIGYTISPHNLGRFEETLEALRSGYPDIRFDDINVNVVQKSDFYYDNSDAEELDGEAVLGEIEKILRMDGDALSLNNFLRRSYLKLYGRYRKLNKCPVRCRALSSTLFIDPRGDLYPCAVYKRKLTNVKDMNGDLAALWKGDAARLIAKECSNEMCPSCWSPCDAYSAIAGSLLKTVVTDHA